ncbi:PQQ-dependent sugar dehydrogenase [Pseudonocardia asaccharolytica]|uniref:Oxidoreductase n=1 Tax=Pseudonocardia asaccharolytica DSM 44247 = NBRC 16224 TaxID=1123024 RepID=A0A511CZG1_9PSEU|nr:PQQ-dependent sugar dehydrogenase [Pseudonocardia asaccharolytica]GEL17857.1 oxidoreductase [Pseudonocardia asaccharolytica DSM 44247 = NBRC 16224]
MRIAAAGIVLGLSLVLAACAGATPPTSSGAGSAVEVAATAPSGSLLPQRPVGTPRTLVTGLEVPWGLAFLPDGSALVTERESARLLRVSPDGAVTPVGTVAGVAVRGEGGLLGIAVSPNFRTDRAVFVYYTSVTDNRVVRLRAAPDGTIDGAAQQVLVSGIPAASIHNGGGLAFGPDGLLYVATGDAGRRDPAQDLDDLGGKILRITPDGAPAAGNPFGTAVFTYGHRNVQGLAFGPEGRLYAAEFGQNRVDEINLLTPGANYGWPTVEGIGHRAGLTDPLLTWETDVASPSGLAYAGGSLWAGALRGQRLWRVPLADGAGGVGTPAPLFTGEFGRLRTVVATPDGSALWITTSNRDGRGSPTTEDDRILVVPLS